MQRIFFSHIFVSLDKMQTTTIGPRRSVVAPQRQPSRSSTSDVQRPQDVVSLSHSLAANSLLTHDSTNLASSSAPPPAGESTENNASTTPPLISGTVDNMFNDNYNPQVSHMDLPKPASASLRNNLDLGSRDESVSRKVQSLVTVTSNGNALAFVLLCLLLCNHLKVNCLVVYLRILL